MSDSPDSVPPRKLSPMAILVASFFGFLILIVAFIGIVTMFDTKPIPENVLEPMLASRTMPDGSQLILKAATLGTTHELNQPYPRPENSMFTARPDEARMSFTLVEERLGLWFEQFHSPGYEPDDLSWWMRTSVLDENGNEIFDLDSTRFVQYQFGGSSELGGRPYAPVDRRNQVQIVAGVAMFPIFRNSNDTLTVRIYGTDPKPVAEFEIPNPLKAKSLPVWSPEPFPISKTISGVTMTLDDVQYFRKKWTRDAGVESFNFRLKPSYTVTENGELIQDGLVDPYWVSDAIGHQGGNVNPGLPLDEAAWKISIPWRRNPKSVTDMSRFVVSKEFTPISPEKTPERMFEPLRCRTSLILVLANGAGEHELKDFRLRNTPPWSNPAPGSMMTSTSFAGDHHSIEFEDDSGGFTLHKLQIRSHVSWLVLQIEASLEEKVDLLLLDENDEIIESQAVQAHKLTVLLFEPPEGPVRLKAVVQEALPFEFMFAPPEVVDE